MNKPTFMVMWIMIAVATTGLALTMYIAIQQEMRISANDPQIQLSEDTAAALAQGKAAKTLVSGSVNIANSLASYIIVFNQKEQPVISSGVLNGKTPTIPTGVFTYAKQHHQDRLTWQPQSGVRSAIVVTYYHQGKNEGYVVAGRNLREVEQREFKLGDEIFAGWLATLVVSLLVGSTYERLMGKKP